MPLRPWQKTNTKRNKQIVAYRDGLNGKEKHSWRAIGKIFKINHVRAMRIYNREVAKKKNES